MIVDFFSQFAFLKSGLSGAGMSIGEVDIVSTMGIWSLVVSGPGLICVLW